MSSKVFFITGTSTGFGHDYVNIALKNGHKVVATARNSSKLEFDGASDSNLLLQDLNVIDKASIDAAFAAALKKFGRIDIVCNNAGFGLAGEFESLKDEQIRKQMEVNFFGLIDVTRKAMETLRDQKPSGGIIQQITSIAGQKGTPLFSIYCASKWAVEGFTEAIAQEVKPEWGIKFTCIEPGGFKTKWLGENLEFGVNHPAYDHLDAKKFTAEWHGKQAGDSYKGAQAFFDLAMLKDPPLRCIVGTDAYAAINRKLEQYQKNVKEFEKLSNSTDRDGYKAPA